MKNNGITGRIIELPRRGRVSFSDAYLVQGPKGWGHDGLGVAREKSKNVHWARDEELKLIRRGEPPTPFEQRVQRYIDREFKQLGIERNGL